MLGCNLVHSAVLCRKLALHRRSLPDAEEAGTARRKDSSRCTTTRGWIQDSDLADLSSPLMKKDRLDLFRPVNKKENYSVLDLADLSSPLMNKDLLTFLRKSKTPSANLLTLNDYYEAKTGGLRSTSCGLSLARKIAGVLGVGERESVATHARVRRRGDAARPRSSVGDDQV